MRTRRTKLANYRDILKRSGNVTYVNDQFLENPDVSMWENIFQKSSKELDFTPSCECGHYRSKNYEGHVCPSCNAVVKSNFVNSYMPNKWFRIPDELPPFIHPVIYRVLAAHSSRIRPPAKNKTTGKNSKVPTIDMVLDPDQQLPEDMKPYIQGQGMRYFQENAREILRFLLVDYREMQKKPVALDILDLCEKELDADNFFIRNLPMLHPVFHPMHFRGKSKVIDKTANIILPVLVNLTSTTYSNRHLVGSQKNADRNVWRSFKDYISYISNILSLKIGDKHAIMRKHVVASRCHWTGRSVISPIVERHQGNEVHLPWHIATTVHQLEIVNFLTNRYKYSFTDAIDLYYTHIHRYHPTIHEILNTLIDEAPDIGILVILNRNPSLLMENNREGFVTKIKTDPKDKTVNLSDRICKGFNADFDGEDTLPSVVKTHPVSPCFLDM